MSARELLLVLDTATRTPVLGLTRGDGTLVADRRWHSQHRHGEQLLEELDGLLQEAAAQVTDLVGVIVGTGPGSFTGLRIGLATAKVVAYTLELPIVGVPTTHALALAVAGAGPSQRELAVTLPAGVADRYVARLSVADGDVQELASPMLVATPEAFQQAAAGADLLAVDLPAGALTGDAAARGRQAIDGLARALGVLGSNVLRDGRTDDVARLVPAYVALPRGIERAAESMVWSPDLR